MHAVIKSSIMCSLNSIPSTPKHVQSYTRFQFNSYHAKIIVYNLHKRNMRFKCSANYKGII